MWTVPRPCPDLPSGPVPMSRSEPALSADVEPAALTASLFATGGQALQGIEKHDLAPGIALKKAKIAVQGDRYPEHLQKLVGR